MPFCLLFVVCWLLVGKLLFVICEAQKIIISNRHRIHRFNKFKMYITYVTIVICFIFRNNEIFNKAKW